VIEPTLIDTCLDSWASHPFLEHHPVEELPGFDAYDHD
jgi:hypothetical protein